MKSYGEPSVRKVYKASIGQRMTLSGLQREQKLGIIWASFDLILGLR